MTQVLSKKSFFGAALGTLIEYYDYTLFFIFMPILSPIFFPAGSNYASLTKGYLIMFAAVLARPLGALFFGRIGDAVGRRRALLGSMYGIAAATFIIGVTPSYASIGIWSTIIVFLAKSIQLFCFGGEYSGAGIYVVEHAQNNREGLMGSLLTATMLSGALLASLIGTLLTTSLMPAWSWRIAFIIGGIIGVIGIFYRKTLLESPGFNEVDLKRDNTWRLFREFPREILAGILIGGLATVPYSTVLLFILPVMSAKGFISNHVMMIIHGGLNMVAITALLFVGLIADKFTPRKVMLFSAVLLVLISYPLFKIIDSMNILLMIPAFIIIVMLNELFFGPSNAFFKNHFPMQYRYRGSSLSFCIGLAIFGGLTPIVESYLYNKTGSFSAIAVYLIIISLGALLSILLVKQHKYDLIKETILPSV